MKHKYIKSLSVFLALVLMLGSIFAVLPNMARAEEQTFVETFDNYTSENAGQYLDGSFIGNNDIEWHYIHAREGLEDSGNDYSIDGKGIMLRRSGGNSKIYATIDGGIKDFSVDLKKAFTSGTERKVEVFINDESKGTFTLDNSNTGVQKFEVKDINVEGTFNLEIRHISGGSKNAQITVDNITWTTYSGGGTPTEPVQVESISISGANEVFVGNTTKLEVAYTPENTTEKGIAWASSDETIATVDGNGVVKGVAAGTATITATSTVNDNIKANHEISVKAVELMNISEARELADGATVSVQGIVTFIDSNNNYYIQDETAGIDLFKSKQDLGLDVGDMAKVTGKLATYNGLREIVPDNVVKVSSGNPLPEPKVVTIPEVNNYQSQRVKIERVTLGTINTDGNTEITDLQGNKVNIYRVPELTHVKEGDLVDVISIASIFNTPQLRVRVAEDIVKVELGPDTEAPVIGHTPVAEANKNLDLEIKAKVSDDREVKEVKLFYRTKGETEFKSKEMTLSGEEYIAVVLKDELNKAGLEYYIWAFDGTNEATSPEDKNTPYEVAIKDTDIVKPTITNIEPTDGQVLEKTNTKPTIKAEYTDESGIVTSSVQMLIDGVDVTEKATINEKSITYTPTEDLNQGTHMVTVKVKDKVGNEESKTWTFSIGEQEYHFYFGQVHSHTNVSDGTGTPDDAYTWARDKGKADFFAVTDHSNWFDNELDNENITSVSESTSEKWRLLHEKADNYNKDGEYVALAGYEMTWSGSTGGWGHMNTLNTPWFASRSNKNMDLKAYYNKISQYPDSINQLNHPGKTFGDFADFGYYSEKTDKVVQLVEVGNGEGPIRGSGYFPSYEYYTRALDKGWHLAPSNNQDNHKGNWITSNEARTVILSPELTRDSISDSIRAMRVYSTEDKNLEVMYKVNGKIMGSQLDSPEKLNISINIKDPDSDDKISKVEIISNGGTVAASKNFDSNIVEWNLELDPMYNYYYVKVTQADKDIAVTAPIWTSEVTPVGLSGVEVSSDYFELGDTVDLSANVYNNGEKILNSAKVEFYVGSIDAKNKIGEETVTNIAQGSTAKATISWTPKEIGEYNLYAVATIEGIDKAFTGSTKAKVVPKGSAVKVMIDHAHSNHYISGDYAGKDESIREMLKNKRMILVENHDTITDSVLEDIDILIITSPQPKDKGEVKKSKLSDEEIQVVKKFTDRGGSLILTSRANYGDGTGDYQNSIQGNKVLNAIGSNLIFNSDQVVDYEKNGGQQYRLYLDKYASQKYNLTKGIEDGDQYSFYSGCSVLLKDGGSDENVDFLVKGHDTTKNENAGKTPTGFIETAQGNVYVLAAEVLPSGGKIIVSGSTFFSDFEMSGDNRYSNIQVADNVLNWLKPERQVESKTIKEVRDGMPENFGQTFAIEGRITAMSEAYSKEHNLNNAFFEVIYVQDETGGMTVFGVSQTKLPLGTKVRIIGTAGQYEGDYQLQLKNEAEDLIVLDDPIVVVEPKLMSTADSMKKENEGWLVKVQGEVTRIDNEKNSIYIKDESREEARIYVNGYIGDGTGDETKLGKWDPNIKVGDTITAIGLASTDPEGPRLRVRNTAEIVRKEVVPSKYPIVVGEVEETENEGKLTIKVNAENVSGKKVNGVAILKLIDNNGRGYKIQYKVSDMIAGNNVIEFNLNSSDYPKGIKDIKVYIWDSFENMKPLSDVKSKTF